MDRWKFLIVAASAAAALAVGLGAQAGVQSYAGPHRFAQVAHAESAGDLR
ncbi:hypothetical protein [Phenylobacterium hankyongense]|nr:hypothetical protein [Phenylobacterium hankyongense]